MGLLRDLAALVLRKQMGRAAAQLAYYLVLTIFPLLICVTALLGLLDLSETEAVRQLGDLLPTASFELLTDYLDYVAENYSAPMALAALTVVLTAASAAFRALCTFMAELEEARPPVSFAHTVLSFLYALAFIVVMFLSCLVVLTGQWFVDWLAAFTGRTVFLSFWPVLRYLLLFLLLFGALWGLYKLAAPPESRRRQRVIGAAAAALGMVAAGVFFGWTIGLSSKYPLIYGSLASVILLMLWLFLCGSILILGNALNVVLNRRNDSGRGGRHGPTVH